MASSSSCAKCIKSTKATAPPKESALFQKHKKDVRKLMDEGYITSLGEEMEYTFYLIKNRLFISHWSVVITHVGLQDRYFCVHLGFKQENGKCYLYPRVEDINKQYAQNFDKIGSHKKKGKDLMVAAWKAMERLREYDPVYSNCQDFCNIYLEQIGLPLQQRDLDKIKDIANSTSSCCINTRSKGSRRDSHGPAEEGEKADFHPIQGDKIV